MNAQQPEDRPRPPATDSNSPDTPANPHPVTTPGVGTAVANAVRGGLIGAAELVPGVSGGTVALVTGVYEQLIASAHHVLHGVRVAVTGPDRLSAATTELAKVRWWLIIPVLVGMATVVVTFAGLLKSFVTDSPELARGLFLGMVAMSILVPLMMIRPADLRTPGRRALAAGIALAAAASAFFASGVPGGTAENPPKVLVFLAASIAICALVLPGVSGSFFLLTIGLYEPTLDAVHNRDLGYIAVFGSGAAVGLACFVTLLQYLLTHHRTLTLVTMAGLMLGSLRALWPWQTEDRDLLAPSGDIAGVIALMVVGATVVAGLVLVERRAGALRTTHTED